MGRGCICFTHQRQACYAYRGRENVSFLTLQSEIITYYFLGWVASHGKDKLYMLGSALQLRAKKSNLTLQFQLPNSPLCLAVKNLPRTPHQPVILLWTPRNLRRLNSLFLLLIFMPLQNLKSKDHGTQDLFFCLASSYKASDFLDMTQIPLVRW
jgi:hypothetical protein